MKTIVRIGDRRYVMPMKKAVLLMECMGSGIAIDREHVFRKRPDGSTDYREHYVATGREDLCSIEQVSDDQIHIAEGAPTDPEPKPRKSRKALPPLAVRQLGFGGVA